MNDQHELYLAYSSPDPQITASGWRAVLAPRQGVEGSGPPGSNLIVGSNIIGCQCEVNFHPFRKCTGQYHNSEADEFRSGVTSRAS